MIICHCFTRINPIKVKYFKIVHLMSKFFLSSCKNFMCKYVYGGKALGLIQYGWVHRFFNQTQISYRCCIDQLQELHNSHCLNTYLCFNLSNVWLMSILLYFQLLLPLALPLFKWGRSMAYWSIEICLNSCLDLNVLSSFIFGDYMWQALLCIC